MREGAGAPKTRNPSLNGSVSVCIWAAEGGGGFCGITGTPCCGILDGGLCAVRWYGRRGLCCSPWDLHPFLSPSPPHPFPSFSFSSYFPPRDPWMGWVQSDGPRVWWWMSGGMKNTNANTLYRLTELHGFNSTHSCPPHSAFQRPPKIVNIFMNTIHTHRNCNIILFCAITHIDGCYAQIPSQSTKN